MPDWDRLATEHPRYERLKREAAAARDAARRGELMDELRWATISEADHCCLTSKVPNVVKSRYHDSLAGVDEFYSGSASKQLVLYSELESSRATSKPDSKSRSRPRSRDRSRRSRTSSSSQATA
jgi:hypothetical protein